MKILKSLSRPCILCILTLVLNIYAIDATLFVKRAIDRDNTEEPEGASFYVDEVVIQYDKGNFSKELGRRTTRKRYIQTQDKKPEIKILEEEIIGDYDLDEGGSEGDGGGRGDRQRMSTDDENFPFSEKGFTKYVFKYLGQEKFDGRDVYRIAFEPLIDDREYIVGEALFSIEDSLLRKIDFSMAKNMTGLRHFEMSIAFDYIENLRIPKELGMKLHVRIILLVNKSFEVRQRFYDYEILN